MESKLDVWGFLETNGATLGAAPIMIHRKYFPVQQGFFDQPQPLQPPLPQSLAEPRVNI